MLMDRIHQIEGLKPMDITTCLAVHLACSFLTNILLFSLRKCIYMRDYPGCALSAIRMNILVTGCKLLICMQRARQKIEVACFDFV